MDAASLIAFNLAVLGALASPGPAVVAMLRAALSGGRRTGLACGLGLALGALSWSALAVLGLTALFAVAPWAFMTLKLCGAAYLIWLAVSLWRNADAAADAKAPGGVNGFRLGLLTNWANPKAVVFIAAIFTTVFPAMPTGSEALLVLGNHLALELVFYTLLTMGLTIPAIQRAYLKFKSVFDRAAAAVLGAMALRVAT
ncbi:Threonine/homoserine/homoserine lactone efflux protein [Salinihabitans flavidus]|uniref:Threonine/homoserine/homoserine lactone efflux protein n=1 Tax=Salinihabitans flavidus TaxID=569882 RepID=A0A1H8VBH4_9RHOB|nr:LysE family transporter [Salinihabitans flavidus]SEP12810.1 Threonine/homoserine/homoserine lactone efflux protein [Salinihabitans flavidus]